MAKNIFSTVGRVKKRYTGYTKNSFLNSLVMEIDMEMKDMNNKELTMAKTMSSTCITAVFNEKIVLGSLIFMVSFMLLAYLLGNADVAVNPLVPDRLF